MRIKACPKCNAENKETNSACSSCYASLDGVAVTESKTPDSPVQQPPRQSAAPPPQQPGQGPQPEIPQARPAGAPGQPPPSPYGPPTRGPVGPPPMMRERPQPVKSGPNVGAIMFVLILIAGAAFGGWWFFLKPLPPEQVVQKFIDAAKTNDIEKMKPYLTKATVAQVEQQQQRTGKMSIGMGNDPNQKIKVGTATYEGADKSTAIVGVEPEKKSEMPFGIEIKIEVVLLKEDGKWKIDGQASGNRMRDKFMAELKKRGIKLPQVQYGR